MMLDIVILAAGKGTRMRSTLPKVLQPLAGKPLIQHVIDSSKSLSTKALNVVVGHGADQVQVSLGDAHQYILQEQQLGTGHAVQQALPYIADNSIVLILYGDVPLISLKTLESLVAQAGESSLGLLTVILDNPNGYGRIVRDEQHNVTAIVEQKDASIEQQTICEVNTGIMAVHSQHLSEWLPQLSAENAQGEYYLTDIIALASKQNIAINTEQPANEWEVLGVNDRTQQAQLERIYQFEIAKSLMLQGVTLLDPQRFDCRGELHVGADTTIDINCIFEGNVTIGNNVTIGANCIIQNSTIADNTEIKANSIIEDSQIGAACTIGPYARLRPGTVLKEKAKIGNFVETKKAIIGEGSKVNHLSYIGDATLGDNVNIGAGTITCNYDGVNKFQTTIGDDVFVGSNSALIAPLVLEDGATVGAGSTITKAVSKDSLVLARASQKSITGWQRPKKK